MSKSIRKRSELAIAAAACALSIVALAVNGRSAHAAQRSDPHARDTLIAQSEVRAARSTKDERSTPSPHAARGADRTSTAASTSSPARLEAAAPSDTDKHSPTLEAARQRWERLTPEEQLRARERYEKYLALSETERAELAERVQRLKDSSARVQRELT